MVTFLRTISVQASGLIAIASAEPAARWDNSKVHGAGIAAFDYEVVHCFPGQKFPGAVHTQPYSHGGESRLLVAARGGKLHDRTADPNSDAAPVEFRLHKPVAQLLGTKPSQVKLHLMSTLFDRNRQFYVYGKLTNPGRPRNVLLRFQVDSFAPLALTDAEEIITWESNGHDGGELVWGPGDGMLYISAGDRSAAGDPNNTGQRVDDIHGSVLRIDVKSKQPYAVPPDNPFVGIPGVRPEIWSYGLRNPWRMSFHPETHELWVGDNGDENWEMVHRIERGANAGWSAFEGSHIFRASNQLNGPTRVHTPAIVQHPHSEMRSLIGGFFYRGKALPDLQDHYLYGCYFTKRLWAFSYQDGQPGKPFPVADARGGVVAIAEGADREPIITTHDGDLFFLKKKAAAPASRPWPEKLSALGLFTSTTDQQLASGVRHYRVNAEAWSDGATKTRFVAIADGKPMEAQGGAEFGRGLEMPVGSAIGQTLSLDGSPVETQLLYYDGSWRPYTYRWQQDGRDATLVPPEGLDADVSGQKWRFASRAECMVCHTHRSNFTLAFTTPQLDTDGQIGQWIELGLLQKNQELEAERGQATIDPYDPQFDVSARARSYLDLNCAHCHRETGLGGRAGFQLLAKLDLSETAIINAKPTVGLLGLPAARIIAPGAPENSELLHRMSLRGAGQMPLVGSYVIDARGVELIRGWINSLADHSHVSPAGE